MIIAGAGAGTRLGWGQKAFLTLAGKTLLARALELARALPEVGEVVVAAPPDAVAEASLEAARVASDLNVRVVAGGASRRLSVAAALAELGACDLVLVHDVARPLATPELCRRVLEAARQHGAAIPVLPVHDALKQLGPGGVELGLDRSRLVLAQTPQGFSRDLLTRAHELAAAGGREPDDDSELILRSGHQVHVVAGEEANLKLTRSGDLELLEALLSLRGARL